MRLPASPDELRALAARHGLMPVSEAVLVLAARIELMRRERVAVPAAADATVEVPEQGSAGILEEAEAVAAAASAVSQEQPETAADDPLAELDEVLGKRIAADPLA